MQTVNHIEYGSNEVLVYQLDGLANNVVLSTINLADHETWDGGGIFAIDDAAFETLAMIDTFAELGDFLSFGLRHGDTAHESRLTLVESLLMFEELLNAGRPDAVEECVRMGHSLLVASGFCKPLIAIDPNVTALMQQLGD